MENRMVLAVTGRNMIKTMMVVLMMRNFRQHLVMSWINIRDQIRKIGAGKPKCFSLG